MEQAAGRVPACSASPTALAHSAHRISWPSAGARNLQMLTLAGRDARGMGAERLRRRLLSSPAGLPTTPANNAFSSGCASRARLLSQMITTLQSLPNTRVPTNYRPDEPQPGQWNPRPPERPRTSSRALNAESPAGDDGHRDDDQQPAVERSALAALAGNPPTYPNSRLRPLEIRRPNPPNLTPDPLTTATSVIR